MARSGGAAGEFDGTGADDSGNAGVVDPAALVAGNGGGGSGDGSGGGTGDDFDPAVHVSRDKRNADGSYTRKRGRKTTGTASAKAARPVNLAGIESVLLSIHAMMAAATKAPELAIDKEEAKALSEAIGEVAKHYPMTIDPKTLAWVNLVSCAGMVYGPRVYLVRTRHAAEARQRKARENEPGNVTAFPFGSVQ